MTLSDVPERPSQNRPDQTKPDPNQPRIVARDLILKEMILTQLPAMPAARPVPISKKPMKTLYANNKGDSTNYAHKEMAEMRGISESICKERTKEIVVIVKMKERNVCSLSKRSRRCRLGLHSSSRVSRRPRPPYHPRSRRGLESGDGMNRP